MLTVAECAERLGVKEPTIRLWMAQRKLAYVKLGNQRRSAVRIAESEIDRVISRFTVPAAREAR
jgi:excisionase family DNA binding protein